MQTLNTMNSSITQMYSKSSNCNTEKEDMKTSKLAWKSISGTPKTPPGATPTTHMTNDTTKETFAATPTVNGTKQVTFSVPEVASVKQTSNLSALQGLCEGVTPLISRKSTPKKKKRDRSLSDDSAKGQVNAEDKRHYNIKRRKVKEVASVKDGIRSSLKERSVSGEIRGFCLVAEIYSFPSPYILFLRKTWVSVRAMHDRGCVGPGTGLGGLGLYRGWDRARVMQNLG